MKFKTIFILFNIIILFSFLFIFLLPLILLDASYSFLFWGKNWPLALFFVAILLVFNMFFASNWKLFLLVEKEDWPKLADLLKVQLFDKRRFSRRNIRLFINASLLRSDMAAVDSLETLLREKNPAALRREATLFGTSWLLRNDNAGAEKFLYPWLSAKGVENQNWIRFYYAFVLILQKKSIDSVPLLEELMKSTDMVLALLSAYLYGSMGAAAEKNIAQRERMVAAAEDKRLAFAKKFSAERWSKETERSKGEVHIVILSKLIDEAGAWMFGGVKTA